MRKIKVQTYRHNVQENASHIVTMPFLRRCMMDRFMQIWLVF